MPHQAVLKAVADFVNVSDALHRDVVMCVDELKKNTSQFWRRAYARALFAAVEGIIFQMRVVSLRIATLKSLGLEPGEIALLKEEAYELDSKGRARTKAYFANTEKSYRFAVLSFAKVHCSDFEPDYGGQGWENFKRAIEIRNRITHPKEPSGIDVSDAELAILFQAGSWFLATNTALLATCRP